MAPPHSILTKKMDVPPAMVSGEGVVTSEGGGCGGLLEFKCQSALQNLVPYMWQLVFA